jgi:hypothetical protein
MLAAFAAYSIAGYLAYNTIRPKQTILRITILPSPQANMARVEDVITMYTANTDMLSHALLLTTSIAGKLGVLHVAIQMHSTLDFSITIEHRGGSLEWSLRSLEGRLQKCMLLCAIIKR